jgi:hypothetical protein
MFDRILIYLVLPLLIVALVCASAATCATAYGEATEAVWWESMQPVDLHRFTRGDRCAP